MADEETGRLSPISFRYEYAGQGWARTWLSDGVTTLSMDPSYVPNDPLFDLVAAVDHVLTYGGEAGCTWNYEPAADRWTLRRDGDRLHLTIRGVRDGFSRPNWWPTERGEVRFSMVCDLWKFAAKVRLAVSRLEPVEERYHDPTGVQRTPEYRALCASLEEYKRAQHSLPSQSRG
jgi:hypothetical protein